MWTTSNILLLTLLGISCSFFGAVLNDVAQRWMVYPPMFWTRFRRWLSGSGRGERPW